MYRGANALSFNQYKKVWTENKQVILEHDNVGSKSHLVEKIFKEQGGKNSDGSEFILNHEYVPTLEEKLAMEKKLRN